MRLFSFHSDSGDNPSFASEGIVHLVCVVLISSWSAFDLQGMLPVYFSDKNPLPQFFNIFINLRESELAPAIISNDGLVKENHWHVAFSSKKRCNGSIRKYMAVVKNLLRSFLRLENHISIFKRLIDDEEADVCVSRIFQLLRISSRSISKVLV